MEYSSYQRDIFSWLENHGISSFEQEKRNLVVEAVAGSGKTTTIVEGHKYLPNGIDVLDCAFNKHIATTLQPKLPTADVKTYHALGFADIANAVDGGYKSIKVNGYRNDDILKHRLGSQRSFMFSPIKRLVSLFKANLDPYSWDTMNDYIAYYGIDIGDDVGENVYYQMGEEVNYLLDPEHLNLQEIDFDDMCWLPVKLGLKGKKYDYIFVDELQDTNRVQIELALQHANGHTSITGVGDRYQSIYAWRGADADAIPSLIERLNAASLPLSITYRNPLKIVELVQQKYPYIGILPRNNAPDGIVDELAYNKFLQDTVKPGHLVLCRVNAPLIAPAMNLISRGIKAIIKGKDIGKNLQSLVKKIIKRTNPNTFEEFLHNATDYVRSEVAKLRDLEKYALAGILEDNFETLAALSEYCHNTDELLYRIEMIFSDTVEGVTFSSVHRAKGLEAEEVYILHPELIPHPKAKLDWQIKQEHNLDYVAMTRSLNGLHFVY